jgi:hypothetical protein
MGKTPIYGIDGRGVCSPGRICSEVEVQSPVIRAGVTMELAGESVAVVGHDHVDLAAAGHGHVDLAVFGHGHSDLAAAGHGHVDLAVFGHGHSDFAAVGHGHVDLANVSHVHPEYALATHTHAASVAAGVNTVPTLGAGASTTVSVTIKPTLPSTSYTVAAFVVGGLNLLGNLQVTGTSVISTSQVNVTVQNTGLLSLGGASVCVIAVINA